MGRLRTGSRRSSASGGPDWWPKAGIEGFQDYGAERAGERGGEKRQGARRSDWRHWKCSGATQQGMKNWRRPGGQCVAELAAQAWLAAWREVMKMALDEADLGDLRRPGAGVLQRSGTSQIHLPLGGSQ